MAALIFAFCWTQTKWSRFFTWFSLSCTLFSTFHSIYILISFVLFSVLRFKQRYHQSMTTKKLKTRTDYATGHREKIQLTSRHCQSCVNTFCKLSLLIRSIYSLQTHTAIQLVLIMQNLICLNASCCWRCFVKKMSAIFNCTRYFNGSEKTFFSGLFLLSVDFIICWMGFFCVDYALAFIEVNQQYNRSS